VCPWLVDVGRGSCRRSEGRTEAERHPGDTLVQASQNAWRAVSGRPRNSKRHIGKSTPGDGEHPPPTTTVQWRRGGRTLVSTRRPTSATPGSVGGARVVRRPAHLSGEVGVGTVAIPGAATAREGGETTPCGPGEWARRGTTQTSWALEEPALNNLRISVLGERPTIAHLS